VEKGMFAVRAFTRMRELAAVFANPAKPVDELH
jgi:hypothetical protein